MSKSIYISPSSQTENRYAVGGTNEAVQCRRIAQALQAALERCGLTAYAGMDGTMYTRAAESDKLGVNLHLPIHTNAHDGKVAGLRIFVSKLGGEAEQIAKAIMGSLAPITPGESDSINAEPGLYEIKATDAICVYIEVGFHDNPEESRWIIDHTNDIAEAICKGLCKHYGVPYAANAKPAPQFEDVPGDAWYAGDVAYCAAHDLTIGCGDGKFRPEAPITRAEVAALIARLARMLRA